MAVINLVRLAMGMTRCGFLAYRTLPEAKSATKAEGASVLTPRLSTRLLTGGNGFTTGLAWGRVLRKVALCAWAGAGAAVVEGASSRAALKGVGRFSPETGLQLLEHLIRTDKTQAVALLVDWRKLVLMDYLSLFSIWQELLLGHIFLSV